MNEILPKYEGAVKQERDARAKVIDAERRINELYNKQGRKAQFASVAERDDWLESEIDSVKAALAVSGFSHPHFCKV